jgi:Leucine-rich repeat (LRR) protein
MYAEDDEIWVDELVQYWIAEGFVKSKEGTYSMDMQIGYDYVRLLIDRGLFQNYNFEKRSMRNAYKPVNVWKRRWITVHDVIRDMAIHIGEKEGNYLCRAGQGIKDFPQTLTRSCKRISLSQNQIEYLPKDFLCPQLVSLHLFANPLTYNVPESFLINLTALRVLDLSGSRITSVPASLTQLTLLEFLDLNKTLIKELPRDICNLSQLRFLNLSWCKSLTSLPDTIGKLTQLQRVMLSGCNNLVLPAEISQVTSLKRLWWDVGTPTEVLKDPANVIALKGLTNLRELNLSLWLKFEAQELMGSCLEMRHLRLSYNNYVNNTLPHGMQNMKKLETLQLNISVNLPNWICEFEELERLELTNCGEELPSLESLPNLKFLKLEECNGVNNLGIGSSQKPGGFPRLETLVLKYMAQLQSMTCPSCEGGVLKEGTLSNLCVLKIQRCPALKKLPVGMDKLPKLRIYGKIGLV